MSKAHRLPPLVSQESLDRQARAVRLLDVLELVIPLSIVVGLLVAGVALYRFIAPAL